MHEGRFDAAGGGPGDPVTWPTLARHGVACRGPAPEQIRIHADEEELAAWSIANLDGTVRRALPAS